MPSDNDNIVRESIIQLTRLDGWVPAVLGHRKQRKKRVGFDKNGMQTCLQVIWAKQLTSLLDKLVNTWRSGTVKSKTSIRDYKNWFGKGQETDNSTSAESSYSCCMESVKKLYLYNFEVRVVC